MRRVKLDRIDRKIRRAVVFKANGRRLGLHGSRKGLEVAKGSALFGAFGAAPQMTVVARKWGARTMDTVHI